MKYYDTISYAKREKCEETGKNYSVIQPNEAG